MHKATYRLSEIVIIYYYSALYNEVIMTQKKNIKLVYVEPEDYIPKRDLGQKLEKGSWSGLVGNG